MMKRYDHYCTYDGGGPAEPQEEADGEWVRYVDAAAEIERLRGLARRALPMADALDSTKTAVVWTGDLQFGATTLARDIRTALKA